MTKTLTVYTVTPNPALDVSGRVHRIVPNEKNYVFAESRDPGGNGINCARIIHRLRFAPTLALGFLGGCTGAEIEKLLKQEGVPSRFTHIQENNRINVTAYNEADHRQTRLTFPGPTIRRSDIQALLKRIGTLPTPGIVIVGGSTPQGAPLDFHAQLARAASRRKLGVFVDVPAKFFQEFEKKQPLMFIKPNIAELEEWAGRPLRTDSAIVQAGRKLLHLPGKGGIAAIVCISLAARGAFLLCENRVWLGISPKIKAKGTVGAGDSMVGAMASKLAHAGIASIEALWQEAQRPNGGALTEALAWGLAAGAATAQLAGTAHAPASAIRKLRPRAQVKEVRA